MITRLDIKYVRSIGDVSLTFEKGRYKYHDELVLDEKLSNPIAVYGRNGSGKTSLIEALGQLVDFMTADKDDLVPFGFNLANVPKAKNNSTVLKATEASLRVFFDRHGKSFEYYILTGFNSILEETLKVGEVLVLTRTDTKLTINGKDAPVDPSFFPSLRTLANEYDDQSSDIGMAYHFLSNIAVVTNSDKYVANTIGKKSYNDAIVESSDKVKSILRQYGSFPVYDFKSTMNDDGNRTYYIELEKSDKSKLRLPYYLISQGMKSQSFLLTVLLSLPEKGVMVLDEIETALHPMTIMNFLKVARERNIQLIFSSHNTSILSHLRPDNIFFAYWKDGYSTYRRLSDIYPNIREVNNIEKMYLSSTFDGAIEGV